MASAGEEDRSRADGSHIENKTTEEGDRFTGTSSELSTDMNDTSGSPGEDACGSYLSPCSHAVSENLSSSSSSGVSPRIGFSASSSASAAVGSASSSGAYRDLSLAERLANILGNPGEGDLLFRQDSAGSRILQWLQALDQQTIGGCRADERLKPLFKLNVSGGVVEDRLLAHLRQHFEASEVSKLARCLCVPLASVRVGKVIKQGPLLCPTATRGRLKLTLLPSSDFRISFVGDDGCEERLALFSSYDESFKITIDLIPADASGRSFLVQVPNKAVLYYWVSEKSMTVGTELLEKMKDLVERKPSLSQLTGISESRLESLGDYLRSYLLQSATTVHAIPVTNSSTPNTSASLCQGENILPSVRQSARSRLVVSQSSKMHSLHQGSLSPRTSAFKEGLSRTISLSRLGCTFKDKLRRRPEGQHNLLGNDAHLVSSGLPLDCVQTPASDVENENGNQKDSIGNATTCNNHCLPMLNLPGKLQLSDSLRSSVMSLNPLPDLLSLPDIRPLNSFSPCYCWCPPLPSTLQFTAVPPPLPSMANDSSESPLASILSSGNSSALMPSNGALDIGKKSEFPDFFSDPLVRMPLPVSSFIPLPSSQQIPSFTSFISDPIVHIPVIDVCSSGQVYLVSAGPSIPTTISPLLPNLVNKLIPDAESEVEKGARETLRMLISSSQTVPDFLAGVDENLLLIHDKKQGAMVGGSRGIYSGFSNVDVSVCGATDRCNGLLPEATGNGNDGCANNGPRKLQDEVEHCNDGGEPMVSDARGEERL
ncbi:hypothetical protein EJ110_NYTH49459 [Nymphaea thermarum]|nr:hypothetical protein EJ110_NYTH49459 [Nymphaea thermarum]